MAQIQKERSTRKDEELEDVEIPEPTEFDVTDLLDEIDTILEPNAEEFVQGYIQRGGE